jgi:hypothetical protein
MDDPRIRFDGFMPEQPPVSSMQPNQFSAVLAQTAIDAARAALADCESQVPFLVDLDDVKRAALPPVSFNCLPYLVACLNFAKTNPGKMPSDFNVAEFEKDVVLLQALYIVVQAVLKTNERFSDTFRALLGECYKQASSVEKIAKATTPEGELDSAITAMQNPFARRRAKTATTPPPTP